MKMNIVLLKDTNLVVYDFDTSQKTS